MSSFDLTDALQLAVAFVLASLTLAVVASVVGGTPGAYLRAAAGPAANSIAHNDPTSSRA